MITGLPGELRNPLEQLMALPLDPGRLLRLPLGIPRRVGDGLGVIARGSAAGEALVELANKGEVYALVRLVGRLLDVPEGFPLPLVELIARAHDLGDFAALWAIEGLGHEDAAAAWAAGLTPRRLLVDRPGPALPVGSLLMLHAGVGLGIAEHLLDPVDPWSSSERLRRAVRESVALARENSLPGYAGATLESLGLVTGLFHPPLVPRVDAALERETPDVRDYFWHGVGRSLYFSPTSFLPCSTWESFRAAARLAPDERARRNAVAGLAWALCLVNQRQPAVLDELVVAPHGRELCRDGAFANGVASAVVMRDETTPGAAFVEDFCAYRPRRSSPDLWRQLVARPCRRALEVYRPALARAGRLGEVFRFTDLDRLVGELDGGTG